MIALLLIGGTVGVFFPRRALAGLGTAWGLYEAWFTAYLAYLLANHAARHTGMFPPGYILHMIVWAVVDVSLLLLAAWAGSRWRARRMRLAQA